MMQSAPGTITDLRVQEFLARNKTAVAERLPDGSWIVRVAGVALNESIWSKPSAEVAFLVPVGFPNARPDCFVCDQDLRHKDGSLPANAQALVQPHFGTVLWFSYHPQAWDIRSTIDTYLRLILRRLADPR